ncbi:Tn3 family transposase [Streptomyces sp. NPDC054961]
MAAASRPTPETWLLRHWSQQVLRVLGRAHKAVSGRRGELCQHHREGMEDQLGALGLALNAVMLGNSVYVDAAAKQLAAETSPSYRLAAVEASTSGYPRITGVGESSVVPTPSRREARTAHPARCGDGGVLAWRSLGPRPHSRTHITGARTDGGTETDGAVVVE